MHFLKWKWNLLFEINDRNGKRWPSKPLIPKLCWHNHFFFKCENYRRNMLLGEGIFFWEPLSIEIKGFFFPSILWHWNFGTIFQIMKQVGQIYTLKIYQKLHNTLGKKSKLSQKNIDYNHIFLVFALILRSQSSCKTWSMTYVFVWDQQWQHYVNYKVIFVNSYVNLATHLK